MFPHHDATDQTQVLTSKEQRAILSFLHWLDASGYWIVSQQGAHTWEWRYVPPTAWLEAFEQALRESATPPSGLAAGRR